MISFTPDQINEILLTTADNNPCSDKGYFSKPFRVVYHQQNLIVKTFLPISNKKAINFILQNHQDYVNELQGIGIQLPDTFISTIAHENKLQLIIIQQAFKDEELIRDIMTTAPLPEILQLCDLLFADTLKFFYGKNPKTDIGFHPTLRNYAFHQGQLFYFDTFPPMLMNQKQMNRLIITMSPYGKWLKRFIPQSVINRVSNEYFFINKMFIGIVGSCCRLRPELAVDILAYSKAYVTNAAMLPEADKNDILSLLNKPPNLSKLWTTFRKLSGNVGKPNVEDV